MKESVTVREVRQPLDFQGDKGISHSTWIAGAILVSIVTWMGSGFVLSSGATIETQLEASMPTPVTVSAELSIAAPVTLFLQAEGQALPDRDSAVRAEASGIVTRVFVSKGDDVVQGQIIAQLATTQAVADLRRATEELGRAQREFDNSRELRKHGVATEDRVARARTALAGAKAQVAAADETLARTEIVAPFSGRIEMLLINERIYVSAGADVGRIVDNTPLTVSLQVPQRALNLIETDRMAQVTFVTGEAREGRVAFVGTYASSETRTFLVEIEVRNEDGAIPAGISAEITIPTGSEQAHFISPSIVTLSPEGAMGVKTVENGTVVFYQIEVVRAEVDGIWVTGLPPEARIITVGQGYVRDGETVNARLAASQSATTELAQGASE